MELRVYSLYWWLTPSGFLNMMTEKLKLTASTDNLQLNMESKPLPDAQYTLHLLSDFVKRGDNG